MKRANTESASALKDGLDNTSKGEGVKPANDIGTSDASRALKIVRKLKHVPDVVPGDVPPSTETAKNNVGTECVKDEGMKTGPIDINPSSSFTASLKSLKEQTEKVDVPAGLSSLFGAPTLSKSSPPMSSLFGGSAPLFGDAKSGATMPSLFSKPNTGFLSGSGVTQKSSPKSDPTHGAASGILTSSIFSSASTLSGPFGAPTGDASSKEDGQKNSDEEHQDHDTKELIDNDQEIEDGFDLVWCDKSVGLYGLEDEKFRNRGAGSLKVLRKQDEGVNVRDRIVVFRKRGTQQLLMTARMSDNFIMGDDAKSMGNGMKGILFSSLQETTEQTEKEETSKESEKSQLSQFILKFKVDSNRLAFIQHVKQAKEL